MKICIITGSGGLIGSEAVNFFSNKFNLIIGIDNDMRAYFFGKEASTKSSYEHLISKYSNYAHLNIDIRNYEELEKIFSLYEDEIELIIHTAAQPSHDWAMKEPLTDFAINATGTLNLLELTRLKCPKAVFIFTSTNKVYGDRPNISYETGTPDIEYGGMMIEELDSRYDARSVLNDELMEIDETMPIDRCKHSVFGASKVAADIMVQEYGKYFNMNTTVFRGGCLTGPNHAGTELHGFLSYLVKCMVKGDHYKIFGMKGKQVRDNIHSYDLIQMFNEVYENPKQGEVYNAGGGRENSTSILEAINYVNELLEKDNKPLWDNYQILDTPRSGDHIFWVTDLTKFKNHYSNWKGITITLDEVIKQIYKKEKENLKNA